MTSGGRLAGAWSRFVSEGVVAEDDRGASVGSRNARGGRVLAPPRPTVPPAFFVAVGMWAALLAGSAALPGAPDGVPLSVLAAALGAGGVGCALAAWRGGRTVPLFLAVGLALGGALACGNELSLRAAERSLADAGALGERELTAVADASPSDYGASCLARTRLDDGREVRVRVLLDEPAKTDGDARWPLCGERFAVSVARHDTDPEVAGRLRAQGVAGTVEAYASARLLPDKGPVGRLVAVRAQATALFGPFSGDGAALCEAVLFGVRDRLSTEAAEFYADAKTTGLAHLVAVSGSHLVIVAGLAEAALRAVRAPRSVRLAGAAVLVVSYVVLTGMAISAVRAALMACVSLAAALARRRAGGMAGVSVCAIALLAADPTCATSLSFQLSAVSTAGIVAFMPLASAWLAAVLAPPRAVRDVLAMTLAASAVTLPLTAPVFAQVPLVSPLANVLAAPFFAVLCAGGLAAVGVALAVPPAAGAVLTPVVLLAQAFCEMTGVLAGLPCAALPFAGGQAPCALAGCALAAFLWAAWPLPKPGVSRKALAAACCAAAVLLAPALAPGLPLRGAESQVAMLDVGQGDAFLVRSGGRSLLVDTGMQDVALLRGLAEQGVSRLDAVLVTHPDADHCGSLSALRGTVAVDRVLVAQDGLACPCENCAALRDAAERTAPGAIAGLSPGDELRIGRFTARVIGPEAYQDEGGNGDSVCFLLSYDARGDGAAEWSALFTGDAEAERLREYADAGLLESVDVLKVPHHGARAGLDEGLVRTLAPSLALVSVGEGNSYGHPAPEVTELLEGAGARIVRTDRDGTVVLRFEEDALKVSTESG